MAQSERIFRDTLCEGRSFGVETTDPTGARTIDELRKVVKELRASLEGEKAKYRQLSRDHEKQLQHIREEEGKRLDTALEACAIRKDHEKNNELKKLEERLERKRDQELRQLAKEKADELNKLCRKWQAEKNEAVRVAVEVSRRQSLEELHASFSEEEAHAREDKLTREVFMLGEQNESLEQQVRNLSRLNRAQIDQMRRVKQECESRIESILRQHKTEASREMAQLRLAEQIIAEKDHSIRAIEYRADMAILEKEALEEELVTLKSTKSADTSLSETTLRRSVGVGKRIEELESQIKKLEEEKASLKQDNASLRKKLLRDDGEKKQGNKENEEKIRGLKKRNLELMAVNKDQEERIRSLKVANEQLQQKKATPPPVESDQNVRKLLARQHAKDISEYTKQIHNKDREITELRKKIAKLEAIVDTHSEPTPELKDKVKSMAKDKLHMEKLIAKLYSRLPERIDTEDLTNKELASESKVTHSRGKEGEDATLILLQQEKEELLVENKHLSELVQSTSKVESECVLLRQTVEQLESAKSSLEQKCHELSRQLQLSTLAVKELEGSQEISTDLEKQVKRLQEEAMSNENEIATLKMQSEEAIAQLTGKQAIISALQGQVEGLEGHVKEKEEKCAKLQSALEEAEALKQSPKPMVDVGVQSLAAEEDHNSQPVVLSEPLGNGVDSQEHEIQSSPAVLQSDSMTKNHKRENQPVTQSEDIKSGVKSASSTKRRIKSPVRKSLRSHSPRTSSGDVLDSSLDNEMRAAGYEVNDSFDSSEGVGFSDTNIDTSLLESDNSLAIKEDIKAKLPKTGHSSKLAWEEGHPDQAQATGGGGQNLMQNRQEQGDLEDGEVVITEMSTAVQDNAERTPSATPQSESGKVGIYIAKYTYNPSEMSPNSNFDLELPLTAGDYLYVYGEMDDDGFYHAQLMSGESGMVPSNFIERVMDEEEANPEKSQKGPLHDIEEVDEDTSSSGMGAIPPPQELSLERQFVEDNLYTVAIHWKAPRLLPEGATGYSVYVNSEFKCNVHGADQTSILLSGIPRKQLVRISVRTTTEEGESPDSPKPIILNPQYPEAPTRVQVSQSSSPKCLLVQWAPSNPLKEGNTINGYSVFLDKHCCVQLGANPMPVKAVCAQILPDDVKSFREELLAAKSVPLTVCAISGEYHSAHSLPVMLPKEDLLHICASSKMTADESEITSSAASLSSIEDDEEKEVYSPANKKGEEMESQRIEIMSVEGVNGLPSSPPPDFEQNRTGPVRYYRALASYDPSLQSPNEDGAEQELAFSVDDVIVGLTDVDEDGFLFGELNGKSGYIPSNLMEEITDPEELGQIQTILEAQRTGVQDGSRNMNGNQQITDNDKPYKMKAMFDYDPAQDSPNENSEVELALTEGDIITVFGKPDKDGFYKAEKGGKEGLVPSNFLEEMTPPRNEEVEVFAADEESMRIADAFIQMGDAQNKLPSGQSSKRKQQGGGLLSRGRSLLNSIGKRGE